MCFCAFLSAWIPTQEPTSSSIFLSQGFPSENRRREDRVARDTEANSLSFICRKISRYPSLTVNNNWHDATVPALVLGADTTLQWWDKGFLDDAAYGTNSKLGLNMGFNKPKLSRVDKTLFWGLEGCWAWAFLISFLLQGEHEQVPSWNAMFWNTLSLEICLR